MARDSPQMGVSGGGPQRPGADPSIKSNRRSRSPATATAFEHDDTFTREASANSPDGAASRESLFRALNEEIRRIADSFAVDEDLELACECEDRGCFARISVPRDEYEAVRDVSSWFLMRRDHVAAGERVVREAAGYAVVKRVGSAAADGSGVTETGVSRDG